MAATPSPPAPPAVADHAGNPASTATQLVTVDATAPSVVVSISDTELSAGETATVTFAFSEAPVGFSLSAATAAGGSLSDLQVDPTDASRYTATFTPAAATETAGASVSV